MFLMILYHREGGVSNTQELVVVEEIKAQIVDKLSIRVDSKDTKCSGILKIELLYNGETISFDEVYASDIKYLAEF